MIEEAQRSGRFGYQKYGQVTLRGSRAIKHHRLLDAETALEIVYAHRIAKEVLKKLGVDAVRFRMVAASPKEKGDRRNAYGKKVRAPDAFALVSRRTPMDRISKEYFDLFYSSRFSGQTEIRSHGHHKRISATLLSEIENNIRESGLYGHDISPHNIVVTPEGRLVLHEVLSDLGGIIDSRTDSRVLNPGEIFAVQMIKKEYFQKLEELKAELRRGK